MKINIYTIVWNNEFILPHFLKHYSEFANRIFVIDDHSTDLTAEIAKSHPMVSYSKYPFEGLNEDEFSDTFEAFYTSHPSDWAMVADSDEFISHPNMREYLSTKHGVLKTKGYMMIGKSGKLEDCKKVRMRSFDKPVVFEPKLDVYFGDGRHSVNQPTLNSELELLHYKYPSKKFYLERNLEGYKRIAGMNEKEQAKRLKMGLAWYDANV